MTDSNTWWKERAKVIEELGFRYADFSLRVDGSAAFGKPWCQWVPL
jgi:hypothetical protein